MTSPMQIAGGQSQGKRQRQEDAFSIERFAAGEALLLVADGLGGHPGGDVASREGLKGFSRHFTSARTKGTGSPSHWMQDAIHAAQRGLLKQQRDQAELMGMATTLVAFYLQGSELTAASVGDSYLLRLRAGELMRLNELHGENGGVTSAIGFNLTQIDLSKDLKSESGDRYLLASDGIVTLDDGDLIRLMASAASPEEAVHALLSTIESRAHPYQDNTTVVVVFL